MILVELAGPPGAGKTTLLPAVVGGCRAAGLRAWTLTGAARPLAGRTVPGRVAARLPGCALRRRAAWSVFALSRLLHAVRAAWRDPALARYVVASQRRRPPGSEARRRRVLHDYVRCVGGQAYMRRHGRRGEAAVVDEGLVHRALQLHASSVEWPQRDAIERYVGLLPLPDLLVVVHAPERVCAERVRARGVWPRMAHRSAGEIERFVASGARAIALAEEAVRRAGGRVVHVDGTGPPTGVAAQAEHAVARALGGRWRGEARPRWRPPRFALPAPSHVAGLAARAGRKPAVTAAVAGDVLACYGLRLTAGPVDLASGRRNANVLVWSSHGKKVLRRHREVAPATSVEHEHAVLAELQRRGFPAVRPVRSLDGATLVERDGCRYCLFDHQPGVNLSTRWLSTAQRLSLYEAAGRTLARLHAALDGFRPPQPHHLARSATGEDGQGLDWYLDVLAHVPAAGAGDDRLGAAARQALATQRHRIAARLLELHGVLAAADLPQVVIHGDYGLHNLLAGPDGLVVTDFELARREWRLVDLIVVLSRVGAGSGQAFLDGYRSCCGVPGSEWSHLGAVWEYYRLTGAVRSWHSYAEHGGAQRVAATLDRLRQAQSARGEVLARWR